MRRLLLPAAISMLLVIPFGCKDQSNGQSEDHSHTHPHGTQHDNKHGSHGAHGPPKDRDKTTKEDHPRGEHSHSQSDDPEHPDKAPEGEHHHGKSQHRHREEVDHGHTSGRSPSPEKNAHQPGTVALPKSGKRFDPPIKKARLPDGAWYCDLGKVPWASTSKPEAGCPVADAPLKQYHK